MRLHELHPAPGSRRARTRVGRGIAAGKGKTAGRGTKGQGARTGSSSPAWFEGGQTPIHMRVPKLRGFRNRFRVAYAVINVGRIEAALASGRLEPGPRNAPATVNLELLFTAGLVGRLDRPLKILGTGELGHRIMAVADAVSAEARRKIEAAGGTVLIPEPPAAPQSEESAAPAEARTPAPEAEAPSEAAAAMPEEPASSATAVAEPTAAKPRASRPKTASAEPEEETAKPTAAAKPAEESAKPAEKTAKPDLGSTAPVRRRRVKPAAEEQA